MVSATASLLINKMHGRNGLSRELIMGFGLHHLHLPNHTTVSGMLPYAVPCFIALKIDRTCEH